METPATLNPSIDETVTAYLIKRSFISFLNSQKDKAIITQETFDLLHSMRDWIIKDLTKVAEKNGT